MILKPKILLSIIRKNGISVAMVARELGVSKVRWRKVIEERAPLYEEEAGRLLALFGAEEISPSIDWEAIHARRKI